MKKKLDDEVDLIEIFIQIWKKKHIIILDTTISLALGLIYQTLILKEKKYLIKTEIRPLSLVDESEYSAFKSYLSSLEVLFIDQNFSNIDQNFPNEDKLSVYDDNVVNDYKNNLNKSEKNHMFRIKKNFPTYDVNKILLYNLFLEKLSQYQILEKFMKSQVIDENQKNKTKEFKSFISELKSNIENYNNNELGNKDFVDPIIVNFRSNYVNDIISLLNYINQEINIEVYKLNTKIIANYIDYLNLLIKNQIEDIEFQITISNSPIKKQILVNKKNTLLQSRFIERVKEAYEFSPLKSSDFYAAKIHYKISNNKQSSSIKILIFFAFVGIIIGIILILIITAIKSRKLK